MSKEEYNKMVETGMVQEGDGGVTYASSLATPESYGQQAKPGTGYVEFDVPSDSLYPAGGDNWVERPSRVDLGGAEVIN